MNRELIKILLVDDDEDGYIIIRDLLNEIEGMNYELEWVSSYDEALEIIGIDAHDVYLFDYRLGEHNGLELLKKAIKKGCAAPMILLTGQGDHEVDVEAMKMGASDFLVKGMVDASMLERSIRYSLERKRGEERMFQMAFYDSLTDLPNRSLFHDRLEQAIKLAERHKRLVATLYLDLDNFKRINDTFGHKGGDLLLKEVAHRLLGTVRKGDTIARHTADEDNTTVARLGGDEFILLLSEINGIQGAAKVAKRVLDALSRPFQLDGNEVFISTSIGIALYPFDGSDKDTLVKNADSAMYYAKQQGKNNFQFYKQSMNAAALERLTMENNLRKALKRDEFLLYYQPQIDVITGKVVAMEALIRWMQPEMGLLLPESFIPLAEEAGLINPIGEWVMYTACAQNKAWQEKGIFHLPVSVNLSSHQFRGQNIIDTVIGALNETGLAPGNLILEITESAIMQNTESIIAIINELAAMGIQLVLDDFGVGFSSLSYLNKFPFDVIKIDQSFIKEIHTTHSDSVIVKTIIDMAHSLNLKVVAEGVETEMQLDFLREEGCDMVQGFLLSHPLPVDEASVFLTDQKGGMELT